MGAADTRLEFDSAIPPPNIRAFSSAGRAPDLHSGGQEFDPPKVHQILTTESPCTGPGTFTHLGLLIGSIVYGLLH